MFNWFKKKSSILAKWQIPDVAAFRSIQNSDSIQYANADESIVIYFSVLVVSGKGILPVYIGKFDIIEDANGWQLKGTKKFEDQILICVISVNKQDDVEWAKMFFNSIGPH